MKRVQQIVGHLTATDANANAMAVAVVPTAAGGAASKDEKEKGRASAAASLAKNAKTVAEAFAVGDGDNKTPLSLLRWNGWGYSDTAFALNSEGLATLQGDRYLFSGQILPDLRKWMEEKIGLDIRATSPAQAKIQSMHSNPCGGRAARFCPVRVCLPVV
jgi:hypothetical protein